MQVVINGKVVYEPTPRQLAFHQSQARYPLYGGAAAGGKSHALRWHGYLSCLQVPGMKVLLLRRFLPDLKRTHERQVELDKYVLNAKFNSSDHLLMFPNGSTMEFGHAQDDDAVGIYLSAEYSLILFDELVTFSEYQYLMISSRCRTTIPGVMPRVMAATNPGGAQSQWVRRRWVNKDVDPEEDASYDPNDYEYIPATLRDNPHIDQAEYERQLNRLPPELARAYRDGDWDIFLGQYFSEFRRHLHVQELPYPGPEARRICGLDYGYSNEGVCLWAVVLPDGQLFIEDEFVFNGPRRHKQIDVDVAKEIAKRNKERGLTIRATFADPSMWFPSTQTGQPISETFARQGVPLSKGNHDRVNGWQRVRAWLSPMSSDDPRPWMVIHPRCSYLLRTLPQLVMDDTQPEDVDTDGPDHAADALRYLVMGRPAPNVSTPIVEYPPGSVGALKQRLLMPNVPKLGRRNVRLPRYAY